jgi:hypothetical protein
MKTGPKTFPAAGDSQIGVCTVQIYQIALALALPPVSRAICLKYTLDLAFHAFQKTLICRLLQIQSHLFPLKLAQIFFSSAARPQMNRLYPQSVELYMTRRRNGVN